MLKTLLLSAFLLLTGCSDHSKDAADKNIITVATSADNPPYEYIQDGKIVGLDIDIMKAVAGKIGKKLVIKNFDFPGLLPALTSGSIDAVIAALTVTEERKERVDFSRTYATTSMTVLFKKTNDYKTANDLESKTVGVQMGTTWEVFAKDLATRVPNMRVRSLSNNLILVEELKSDSIDAIIMEEMQTAKFMDNIPGMSSFPLAETKSNFAIVLPKDSSLTKQIDDAIDQLQNDGSLNQIKAKWLVPQ